MMHIFVAGTFNVFHDGHRRLLDRAIDEQCKNRGVLVVGITTNEYARAHKDVHVRYYNERYLDVENYLISRNARPYHIRSIDGPGIPSDVITSRDDVLICASDTKDSAMNVLEAIPEERRPRMVVIWRDPAMPSSSEIMKRRVKE